MAVPDRNAAIVRARELRRSMSPTERRLWAVLRTRPGGLKFRKQHPIDPFTADFYCASAKLVVEVDGDSHDLGQRPATDLHRDEMLRARGFTVIRFLAVDVIRNLEAVVKAIVSAAHR